jgi:ribonucleoside-diphosphate reductase alpha chain
VSAAARHLFRTATELGVDEHLVMQHTIQRHVDNAVSKTINLRGDADRETVAHAFCEGWRLGLKGLTVYRTGTRPADVLTLGAGEDWTVHEHFAKCDPGACRL